MKSFFTTSLTVKGYTVTLERVLQKVTCRCSCNMWNRTDQRWDAHAIFRIVDESYFRIDSDMGSTRTEIGKCIAARWGSVIWPPYGN